MDGIQPQRFEFTITEEQVVAATGAAMRRQLSRKPYAPLLIGAYLIAVFLLAVVLEFRELIPLLIAAALAPPIAYFLIMRLGVPWQAKRHYRQVALLSDKAFAEWDEVGITLGGTRGHARLEWSDFYAWQRIPEVLMLYQGEALFNMVPLEAIGSDRADEIVGYLEAAGVKRR